MHQNVLNVPLGDLLFLEVVDFFLQSFVPQQCEEKPMYKSVFESIELFSFLVEHPGHVEKFQETWYELYDKTLNLCFFDSF